MVTEDAFFSHFYRFNHIILHERRRISGKRAATGAVKVQIPAIRPRRARFLNHGVGIMGSVLLIIFKSLIPLCFITCLIRISLNLKNDQKNRPHDRMLLFYLLKSCKFFDEEQCQHEG